MNLFLSTENSEGEIHFPGIIATGLLGPIYSEFFTFVHSSVLIKYAKKIFWPFDFSIVFIELVLFLFFVIRYGAQLSYMLISSIY